MSIAFSHISYFCAAEFLITVVGTDDYKSVQTPDSRWHVSLTNRMFKRIFGWLEPVCCESKPEGADDWNLSLIGLKRAWVKNMRSKRRKKLTDTSSSILWKTKPSRKLHYVGEIVALNSFSLTSDTYLSTSLPGLHTSHVIPSHTGAPVHVSQLTSGNRNQFWNHIFAHNNAAKVKPMHCIFAKISQDCIGGGNSDPNSWRPYSTGVDTIWSMCFHNRSFPVKDFFDSKAKFSEFLKQAVTKHIHKHNNPNPPGKTDHRPYLAMVQNYQLGLTHGPAFDSIRAAIDSCNWTSLVDSCCHGLSREALVMMSQVKEDYNAERLCNGDSQVKSKNWKTVYFAKENWTL